MAGIPALAREAAGPPPGGKLDRGEASGPVRRLPDPPKIALGWSGVSDPNWLEIATRGEGSAEPSTDFRLDL